VKKMIIIMIFFVSTIVSIFLIPLVKVNYDLKQYLPKDSLISESLDVYKDEFGVQTSAYIAFNEQDLSTALTVKNELLQIDNVDKVVFVDDYLNEVMYQIIRSNTPTLQQEILDMSLLALINQGYTYPEALFSLSAYFPEEYQVQITSLYESFISEEEVLFQVIIGLDSADPITEEVIEEIETLMDNNSYTYYLKGEAISTLFTQRTISEETLVITIVLIPIILFVLLLLCKSVFDIVLFMIIASIAILINLGTNFFLPNISFITQAMAIALQLAISLDYIIFVLNAYHSEREKGGDVDTSISLALKKTKRPVIASALTTAVSFLALIIMRFTIGLDIGIVFAKGILVSIITTLMLLPILIKVFSRLIDKTKKHRGIINFSWVSRLVVRTRKVRFIFLIFILVVIAPLIVLHSQQDFSYGVNSFSGSKGTDYYDDLEHINETFGSNNVFVVLMEKNSHMEKQVFQDLVALNFVTKVDAPIYYDELIDDEIVKAMIVESMYSENYALIQVSTNTDGESKEAFTHYETISSLLEERDIDYYILGETALTYNLRDVVNKDFTIVLIVAMLMILIIIFISFKNLLIPIILVMVIQTAVFLAMSILNAFDENLVFLAYLIVSTILLGATIDYAILFSKRYMEERISNTKAISLKNASADSAPSIVTSALLFIISGLVMTFISSIASIAQIGLLIAVGATVSMIFVLLLLPHIIYIFDFLIIKSKVD